MKRVITYNLSDDFIKKIADYTEDNFIRPKKDISSLAFVFGGRRPSLFLKRELSRRIKKPYLSPSFFIIDEFIEYVLSKKEPFKRISDLEASHLLYTLSKDVAPGILAGKESFAQFFPWAKEILSFIEQLDFEGIESVSLKNIQENASIGYDVPQNINALLESIISLRNAYHKELKKRKAYSRGLMYLSCAQYVKEAQLTELREIFFCGFFYLHKTELAVIKQLYDAKKAFLFFQGDEREWPVLKKLAERLDLSIQPKKTEQKKYNLNIRAGFDVHSQAALAREIIKKIEDHDNTVAVLPQAVNVLPLLSEISSCVSDYNVSMGYPLKRSSLYSLFTDIFKAQRTRKAQEYYARDYLKVLAHPLVKNLNLFKNHTITRVLVHKIEEVLTGIEETALAGSLFINLYNIEHSKDLFDVTSRAMKAMDIEVSRDELKSALRALHRSLFLSWEKTGSFSDFSKSGRQLLDLLIKKSFLSKYPMNLKMAERMFELAEELNNASFAKEPFLKEEIFKVFENKLGSEMISFAGSPLKGLQVLGLFETRSLSFENVIFMDVNEAALPALRIYEPLIPRDIMVTLGLNRLEKEEEIQRYQFMRLISGAKNVYLLYQDKDDKEKSRFIEELIWMRQKETGLQEGQRIARVNFKVRVLPKKIKIKKDASMIAYLKEREYSASSINTYLNCPLNFYYQYVLGLEKKEDMLDEPESREVGTFIHELLYQGYAGFLGRKPYIDDRFSKYFLGLFEEKFNTGFERKIKAGAFLTKEIMLFRLKMFLENEKKREVRKIVCLEKKFTRTIRLSGIDFKFKAVIDRIDELDDGSILVLDYKTGSADILPRKAETVLKAGFKRLALKNTVRSFQLPLYLYFADTLGYNGKAINAALYSIKNPSGEDLGLSRLFKAGEASEKIEETKSVYLQALGALVGEIIDPDIAFVADEDNQRLCAHCPFFYLCR
ncbi:MAG: PD-(D/E)XK nuclease family protein [Candidatus Omnitrophica bacterium]|nr:PD-(D/E)XK nuclease family protein [Candidatus Omnitrophota bacterium]